MIAIAPLTLLLLTAAPPSNPLAAARQHLAGGDLDGVFFALDGKTFEASEEDAAADLLATAARKSLEAKDAVFGLQFAQMALRLKPQHAGALEAAAHAQLTQKQFSEAESFADRWIAATDAPAAILFRADLALSQGDWERALDLSSTALDRSLTKEQRKDAHRILTSADEELSATVEARRALVQMDQDLAKAQARAAQEGRPAQLASRSTPSGEVIVYGFKGCGFCTKVMGWLDAKGVRYTYKDILEDKSANTELWRKRTANGITSAGVPVTDVHGRLIQGANMPALEQAVRKVGLLK